LNTFQVTAMNQRWNEYCQQRENVIKQLQTEATNQKARISELENGSRALSRDTQAEVNQVLDENRRLSVEVENVKRQLTNAAGSKGRVSVCMALKEFN